MSYDNEKKVSMWLKTSKSGNKFMAGTVQINGISYDIVLFKNFNKKSEKSPDYTGEVKDKQQTQRTEYQNQKLDNPWHDENVKKVKEVFQGEDDEMPF
jgi:hypothetical protein